MIDVLLINPGNQPALYQGLSAEFTAKEPPLWCRLIASYLVRRNVTAEIIDQENLGLSNQQVLAEVVARQPSLVVIVVHGHQPSASTQKMQATIELCQCLARGSSYPNLIVGGRAAALPAQTMRETGADFVCTGEGPVTVIKLLECLRAKGRVDDVPGLEFFISSREEDGQVEFVSKSTPPAPNVWDLQEMPGGGWDLLDMSVYRAHNWHCLQESSRAPYASIYTSLGCSFSCKFCNIQNPFRVGDALRFMGKANSYRMWPPEMVADEVQYLYDGYGVTNIKIADEMYVLNRAHVLGISDALIKRGLGDKLNFWVYARVDTLNDMELLERMRAGGVKWVCVGIESMSEYVRDGINKNDYTTEDILKACGRLKAAGINLIANFMFGLPDDTLESMEQTFRFSQELKPEWWNGYAVVAYPGTALHREVVANGWELPTSWDGYSHHAKGYLPLRTKYITAQEVLGFRDRAFQRFFRNPDFLKRTEAKFGAAACQGVIDMVSVKLERDNG